MVTPIWEARDCPAIISENVRARPEGLLKIKESIQPRRAASSHSSRNPAKIKRRRAVTRRLCRFSFVRYSFWALVSFMAV